LKREVSTIELNSRISPAKASVWTSYQSQLSATIADKHQLCYEVAWLSNIHWDASTDFFPKSPQREIHFVNIFMQK